MDCREFRETYTDLLDGLLGEADEIRFHEHVAVCSVCRRFDRAYRMGVAALKSAPHARSPRDFTARVLHAVRNDNEVPEPGFASGLAGAALVAALIGFLAVDVRLLDHRPAAASATFGDTVVAVDIPDSRTDSVGLLLRDAALVPPFWNQPATAQVGDAYRASNGALFAVPAVWTGR
jgi:anti-sigma factor RsiW